MLLERIKIDLPNAIGVIIPAVIPLPRNECCDFRMANRRELLISGLDVRRGAYCLVIGRSTGENFALIFQHSNHRKASRFQAYRGFTSVVGRIRKETGLRNARSIGAYAFLKRIAPTVIEMLDQKAPEAPTGDPQCVFYVQGPRYGAGASAVKNEIQKGRNNAAN